MTPRRGQLVTIKGARVAHSAHHDFSWLSLPKWLVVGTFKDRYMHDVLRLQHGDVLVDAHAEHFEVIDVGGVAEPTALAAATTTPPSPPPSAPGEHFGTALHAG